MSKEILKGTEKRMMLTGLSNAAKIYKNDTGVRGLSFEISAGAVTALIGPNGAGKTTTLKMLAGHLSFGGDLLINGVKIEAKDLKNLSRTRFFVPEAKNLTLTWRIKDIIEMAIKASGTDPEWLSRYLKAFHVDVKGKKRVKELSLGNRSSLFLALALASKAPVLLLDEPLTGLDPLVRSRVIDALKERAWAGTAVLYSSHILEEVETLADHLLILDKGVLTYSGSIDSLKERYQEVVIEKPEHPEILASLPGVRRVKKHSAEIYNIFVDKNIFDKTFPGKRFELNLKEIFIYLMEPDDNS